MVERATWATYTRNLAANPLQMQLTPLQMQLTGFAMNQPAVTLPMGSARDLSRAGGLVL
jgi:hypothetical protein